MPESTDHLEARIVLYLLLKLAFAKVACIGSEQFVYWDPTNPKRCLSPDAFVRLGLKNRRFRIWKTWEHGAPDLAVEIVSYTDTPQLPLQEKLRRYRASGIREVVRFDPRAKKNPIRIWDHIDGDLVERSPDAPNFRECEALGLYWTVVGTEEAGPILRLARDPEGRDLLPTPEEEAAQERGALAVEVARLRAELAATKKGPRRAKKHLEASSVPVRSKSSARRK